MRDLSAYNEETGYLIQSLTGIRTVGEESWADSALALEEPGKVD